MQGVVQDASEPSGVYGLTSRYGSVRPAEHGSLLVTGGHITSVLLTLLFFPLRRAHPTKSLHLPSASVALRLASQRKVRTSDSSLWRCSEGPICECKKALTALLCPAKFLRVTGGVSLNHFLPFLRSSPILVRSDNFTLVAYINLQGGTHFPRLHKLTCSIIMWISLWVSQVQGKINRGTGLL